MICTIIVCAVQSAGLLLGTAHERGGFNSFTPGAYVTNPQGYLAASFRNSESKPGAFIGRALMVDVGRADIGIAAGVALGYGKPAVGVIGLVGVPINDNVKARIMVIPRDPRKERGTAAATIGIEASFK